MTRRHSTDPWQKLGLRLANFAAGGTVLIGLLGAFFDSGDAVLGMDPHQLKAAFVCLWAVAFAYIFLRILPRVWQFMRSVFK